jgi:hypothetical protein
MTPTTLRPGERWKTENGTLRTLIARRTIRRAEGELWVFFTVRNRGDMRYQTWTQWKSLDWRNLDIRSYYGLWSALKDFRERR